MPSWHRSYRGQSIGRVLHFLYHYCGFDVAEMAAIGETMVHYHGDVIATYEFLSDTDIPHFKFVSHPRLHRGDELVQMWEKAQQERVFDAIRDADPTKPEPCKECRILKLKLSMQEDLCKNHHVSKPKVQP